jgi:ABC-type uncharacterized transport system substrate-binding protein
MHLNIHRIIVATVAGILLASFAGAGQPAAKMATVGVLSLGQSSPPAFETLRGALRELGYIEGETLRLEVRGAAGQEQALPKLAAELVQLQVDVIFAGGDAAVRAAKQATRTIPIVMFVNGDPVGSGLVASLKRPGGNVMGIRLHPVAIRSPDAFEPGFQAMVKEQVDGLVVLSTAFTFIYRTQIVKLAAESRLPAIYERKEFVEIGGLMAYGPSFPDMLRQAAMYIDKILQGAKPSTLPVAQPTKFELAVNLEAANALGLTIPPSLLSWAEVVMR